MEKPSLVDLAKALVNDEFFYHIHPVVSLETGTIIGGECLLRWRDETGSIHYPGEFIPLAEESGFIVDIGRAMLPKLAAHLRELNSSFPEFFLTVNISQPELESNRFVEDFVSAIQDAGANLANIRVEITERVFFPGYEKTQLAVQRLSDLGVQMLLDDFGVGYSSVEYLSQLPLVALKVAFELVNSIHEQVYNFKVMRHLIGLGHQLGLYIIAEGIESEEGLTLLASSGCTEVQGFLFGKPLPFDEFLRQVQEGRRIWTGYPFGLDYLAQFDHIDLRRDLIGEVLVLHTRHDEETRQRSLARLPNIDAHSCLFGKWYYGAGRLRLTNAENYKALGVAHEDFHESCHRLLEAANQGQPLQVLIAIISELSEQSREVMSLA